jgi:hypothetical protein
MNDRRVNEYVESYSIVTSIIIDELHFPNRSALYKYLAETTEYKDSTIPEIFKGRPAPDFFFRSIADFLAAEAIKKNIEESVDQYYSRIIAPIRRADAEKQSRFAASPDLPDRLGDGPNESPVANNLVEDLVQFDVMVTGGNYSELGRFLVLELSFRSSSISVGEKQFDLQLTRCQLKLSLDSAMADRGEERIIEDEKNSALRIKISAGDGVGRTRSWEVAHLETNDPLAGTFVVDPLCKIEQEIKPQDKARLVAKAANVRVISDGLIQANPEKQLVIDQLMRVRNLPIERDGSILFSLQKLRR